MKNCRVLRRVLARSHGPSPGSVYRHNENGKKTIIGLTSKKQLCTCNTLFLYISLPLFCTTSTWNFQKLFYGGNVVRVLVHFFFNCRSFSPCIGGRKHCHRRYKIFMLFFQQKNVSLAFYLSLYISVAPFPFVFRWPAAFSPSFSGSIFEFVDMIINRSLIL